MTKKRAAAALYHHHYHHHHHRQPLPLSGPHNCNKTKKIKVKYNKILLYCRLYASAQLQ